MKINFNKLIINLIVILVLFYVGMTFLNQQKKLDSYDANISYLNGEIKESSEYQTQLAEIKENINSQEYIEKIAREKLNMYKSNEKVYVDISN